MTKLQFIAVSVGMLGLGMIFSYNLDKDVKEVVTQQGKTKHVQSEREDDNLKIKVMKHETWYGDTMLVTVDTTYYYNK